MVYGSTGAADIQSALESWWRPSVSTRSSSSRAHSCSIRVPVPPFEAAERVGEYRLTAVIEYSERGLIGAGGTDNERTEGRLDVAAGQADSIDDSHWTALHDAVDARNTTDPPERADLTPEFGRARRKLRTVERWIPAGPTATAGD